MSGAYFRADGPRGVTEKSSVVNAAALQTISSLTCVICYDYVESAGLR